MEEFVMGALSVVLGVVLGAGIVSSAQKPKDENKGKLD